MSLDLRSPTIAEIFPLAAKQQLLNIQSTHLVNQTLVKGGITEALSEMPLELAIKPNQGIVVDSVVAPSLVGTYFKNNWPVLLLAVVVGGVVVYVATDLNKQKVKKQEKC